MLCFRNRDKFKKKIKIKKNFSEKFRSQHVFFSPITLCELIKPKGKSNQEIQRQRDHWELLVFIFGNLITFGKNKKVKIIEVSIFTVAVLNMN
jgi:hypothetical protein